MKIDIREVVKDKVDVIVFADNGVEWFNATTLAKCVDRIEIKDEEGSDVVIESKEDARNLIKALEKALELGWWD